MYVFTQILEACSGGLLLFQVSLKVLSLMMEIEAPVSTSINTSTPSTIIGTFIGAAQGADNLKSE